MKAILPTVITLFLYTGLSATIHDVGSGKTYPTPNALYLANESSSFIQNGDTICIEAAIYAGQHGLAVWRADDLVILGQNGRPHLRADGVNIWGKGIWVCAGNDITVRNIEFSGSTVPDKNGAGIRLDGIGLTVQQCYFHDNENGILTSNPDDGDILIEFCEFGYNGYGDGFSHNLYIGHVNTLTFRYNYSHHADIGHNLKSRAQENYILYNRIMDEDSGNSSRLIDLSNGGIAVIIGNVFMQGPQAENNNLIGYGLEGLTSGLTHELYIVYNTCVNKRVASCVYVQIQNGTSVALVRNNIFAGTGTVINGSTTSMSNNYINSDISELQFQDELNYDYHLTDQSPALDYGVMLGTVQGILLDPDFMYEHPLSAGPRGVAGMAPDAGAYEYDVVSGAGHLVANPVDIQVYPNPFEDWLILNGDLQDFEIYLLNSSGQVLENMTDEGSPLYIQTSEFSSGIYFIQMQHKMDSELSVRKLIKVIP